MFEDEEEQKEEQEGSTQGFEYDDEALGTLLSLGIGEVSFLILSFLNTSLFLSWCPGGRR